MTAVPKAPNETPKPADSSEETEHKKRERYELINRVLGRETFIDPLMPDKITEAYSLFEKDPSKILQVVTANFQSHCRKCIRETALIAYKNEISNATFEKAENIRNTVIEKMFDKVKADSELEQLLLMLIFKNQYWKWVWRGLKEIFTEQRTLPGNPLNTHLNYRFHKLKKAKGYRIIGDLLHADITEIVNNFKNAVIKRKIRIFS